MVFCGDMAVPNAKCGRALVEGIDKSGTFRDEIVIINLEGVLKADNPTDTFWKVYNDKSILDLRNSCKKLIFNLANNHIYDYPGDIDWMLQQFRTRDIGWFGLQEENGLAKPLEFTEGTVRYAIFGHCWQVYTKTNPNKQTTHRVYDCTYRQFYDAVAEYMQANPNTKVICCFHWNFDMETHPFPAHVRIARALIDLGVEAVIGNHAHCPQMAELYKGKVIAYGQGNFYMPDGFFFNGTLCYPAQSHRMYVIRTTPEGAEQIWFDTDGAEGSAISADVWEKLEPVENMPVEEYDDYFRRNRKKRKLVPIFKTYEDSLSNRIKTGFCIWRIRGVRLLKMVLDKIRRS